MDFKKFQVLNSGSEDGYSENLLQLSTLTVGKWYTVI
jgi:hypothetical protein